MAAELERRSGRFWQFGQRLFRNRFGGRGNVLVSIGLACAGLYVMYEELFVRYSGIHGRYRPFGVGLVLFGSGVVWLWFYVVGPIVLRRLAREE